MSKPNLKLAASAPRDPSRAALAEALSVRDDVARRVVANVEQLDALSRRISEATAALEAARKAKSAAETSDFDLSDLDRELARRSDTATRANREIADTEGRIAVLAAAKAAVIKQSKELENEAAYASSHINDAIRPIFETIIQDLIPKYDQAAQEAERLRRALETAATIAGYHTPDDRRTWGHLTWRQPDPERHVARLNEFTVALKADADAPLPSF